MPSQRNPRALDGDALQALIKAGKGSPVVRARAEWAAAEGFRRYAESIAKVARVHPSMLPTQATGRWRISEPPIINFPDSAKAEKKGLPALRECFLPDTGRYWIGWDWNALHGVFMAVATGDLDDLEAFRNRLDVHTITCCRVFKYPLPPSLIGDEIHGGASCREWRDKHEWLGDGDRRRHLMKTIRYALYNAYDEKGVLEAKDVDELGLSMVEILNYARAYLRVKRGMVDFKCAYCEEAIRTGIARSVYGRRRVIRGSDYKTMFKAAISQWLQGTEADILEMVLIDAIARFPQCWLVYPSHDGVKLSFPESIPAEEAKAGLLPIVERDFSMGPHTVPLTAKWGVTRADGRHEKI